jgi:ParB family transcriptional regulator, chromosome partitioning protein
MSIEHIPLSQLVSSPRNVRKTGGASIDDLAASIHAHGLLQNLVVSADGKGKFMVEAGQRRHLAMQQLVKADKLPEEYAVPCKVLDTGIRASTEASLAENVIRQDMHPADEFDAFKDLVDKSESIGEVAARFGKSDLYVQQRLKLANVAPELMKAYRAGSATLEQMMTLALTDDQALQLKIWKAAKQDWQRRPHELRMAIVAKETRMDSKLGKFVGVEAYEQAGGAVRRDLFGSDVFLQDGALLNKLALAKLEAAAEKIRSKEGWSWVEARVSFEYSDRHQFEGAPHSYKSGKQSWTDAVKATAGAVITIGHDGNVETCRGLVRPKDKKAAAKAGSGTTQRGKPTKPARAAGEISFAAVQRLQAEATGILQLEISMHTRTALALLASELAARAFYGTSGYGYQNGDQRQWIHIQRESAGRMPGNLRDVIPKSAAGKKFAAAESTWKALLPKKKVELRDWMLEQDFERISKLLAFLASRELDVVDIFPTSKQGAVDLAATAKVDLSQHWTPSVEWLATLPKSVIVSMVTEAAGKVVAAPLAKMKRDQLPKAAIALLPAGWLPKPLRSKVLKVATKKTATKKVAAKVKA